MLYREIIAVCSQIHTKHINTLYGQNDDFGTLNLAVTKLTTSSKEFYANYDLPIRRRECKIGLVAIVSTASCHRAISP